jgi:trehalose-6-phosphate synthase
MRESLEAGVLMRNSGIESSSCHSQDAWVADFFSNRSLIIAANRGPMTFEKDQHGILQSKVGEGGLVKALLGLCRHADVTWIACARTDADATWP